MPDDLKDRLLDAALTHVPFDGWCDATLMSAAQDIDLSADEARRIFPRGALDMARAFHERGDAVMVARMATEDLSEMRYSARVAAGVRFRLEAIDDKEIVRRGMSLFALPQNSVEGARLMWGTADHIWRALGDTSDGYQLVF